MDRKSAQSGRLVTEIVVFYRPADDPKAEPRRLTLRHRGDGADVDAISWSRTLMEKLAYLENDVCRQPEIRSGENWEVVWEKDVAGDCVWVHDASCEWHQVCETP